MCLAAPLLSPRPMRRSRAVHPREITIRRLRVARGMQAQEHVGERWALPFAWCVRRDALDGTAHLAESGRAPQRLEEGGGAWCRAKRYLRRYKEVPLLFVKVVRVEVSAGPAPRSASRFFGKSSSREMIRIHLPLYPAPDPSRALPLGTEGSSASR
jgi:hypothetical protein